MNQNLDRHLELSAKFMEMGQALVKEGLQLSDHSIIQSGNIFIMLGGMIVNEVEMFEFIDYCSKFSSKKLLDGMDASGSDLSKYIQASNDISIEDYIKQIRKQRKDKPNDESDGEKPSDSN
jgi:hypothetical protein